MISFKHTWSIKPIGLILFIGIFYQAAAQGPEWSEKDLSKSVHRAEQTFQAGEMSRAYGLFAHLVSVASDRPFLHFRFGATCTYTTQRLHEAEEHLKIAQELGILETKHAAEWHYYMGRLWHLKYDFDRARVHLRMALDTEDTQSHWIEDAKLRYGQCDNQSSFPEEFVILESKEVLISHSKDFFRLYEMPVNEGRLLVVPKQLTSKEDKKRGYASQLHWLPGKRFAYFASYGKNGDTGLDIYRVAVDGFGDYGEPVRMPAPINSDFDDCSPICISGHPQSQGEDRLYFSSSRPESIGGFDIFSVDGTFTNTEIVVHNDARAIQLPFEVNSASNEFLFFENQTTGEGWLTTSRNQDFEGQEVWRFNPNWKPVGPVGITLQNGETNHTGRIAVYSEDGHEIFDLQLEPGETADVLLQSDVDFTIHWETQEGQSMKEELVRLPTHWAQSVLSNPIVLSVEESSRLQNQIDENTPIAQRNLNWTERAIPSQVFSEQFAEVLSGEVLAHIRSRQMNEISIEKVLQAATEKKEDAPDQQSLPEWMLNAMQEANLMAPGKPTPKTVYHARAAALQIQSQMEKAQCWDAPGADEWKIQSVIARYGEPSLAVLSDETRELRNTTERQRDLWEDWHHAVYNYMRSMGVESEDWNIMLTYFDAQLQSFDGAVVHAADMFRRIDSHLRYERWLAEALPMNVPGFKEGLIDLATQSSETQAALHAVAQKIADNSDSVDASTSVHNILWETITDNILDLQSLGIYDLNGMEEPQAWFLRSGGIMDDIVEIQNPMDRISKGQQAIGLAWETYQAGAKHYDRVLEESQMSPGQWWRNFRPVDNNLAPINQAESFEGYALFESNDDIILDQANQYQSELDIIRTTSSEDHRHVQSMKNALVMRSNIANEMTALFGGEARTQGTITVKKATSPITGTTLPEPIETLISENEVDHTAAVTANNSSMEFSSARITIQVGAFVNEPDFSDVPNGESIFKLKSEGPITKYAIGSYENKATALSALDEIRNWAPDAFLTLHTAVHAPKDMPQVTRAETPVERTAKTKKSVKATPSEETQATITQRKQFHVHIKDYNDVLKPTEVAKLLRLGNIVPLKTTRLANKTVYYSYPYASIDEAKSVLEQCLQHGFPDAEIEVVY